jgi:hypothetical protein
MIKIPVGDGCGDCFAAISSAEILRRFLLDAGLEKT